MFIYQGDHITDTLRNRSHIIKALKVNTLINYMACCLMSRLR